MRNRPPTSTISDSVNDVNTTEEDAADYGVNEEEEMLQNVEELQ